MISRSARALLALTVAGMGAALASAIGAEPAQARGGVPLVGRDTIPRPGAVGVDTPPSPDPRGMPVRPGGDTVPPRRRAPGDTARAAGDTVPRRSFPQDSLYEALLRLPGYTAIEYEGDSARFTRSDRVLRLRGRPRVERLGTELQSVDSILYREGARVVEAYGRPRVTGEGQDVTGDVMYYAFDERRATVLGARTRITDQATWYVYGNVTQEQGERIYATSGSFTTDDREVPAYHFEAGKVMIVRDRILVGRPATLYFRDVPVMVLPFVVQDLKKGRRSGLLIPDFTINDIVRTNSRLGTRGTGREISNLGWYWAINEYMGAQVSGGWRSGNYTSLAGNLDYRVARRFLNGGVRFENFWRGEGEGRTFNLNSNNSWQPNERTSISLNANFASQSGFERDRTADPMRVTQNLSSSLAVTRKLDWGSFSLNGERTQSLANDDVDMTLPTFRLNVNPITLFPAGSSAGARWYNDAVLTVGLDGSRSTKRPGEGLRTRRRDQDVSQLNVSQSFTMGNLGISSSASMRRQEHGALAAIEPDTSLNVAPALLRAFPRSVTGNGRWQTGISYRQTLIGSTFLSPSVSIGQEFISRDSVFDATPPDSIASAYGRYVAGPTRLNLNASLNTDLYGFFPGFGSYEAIRHHLKPGFAYTYSPRVEQTQQQRIAFGRFGGEAQNYLTINLSQTFEAKLRETRREPPSQDTLAALMDSTRARPGGSGPSAGGDPRKITMLAITTSALAYNFRPDTLGRSFTTTDITNSITSDYFGGVQFTLGHSLFEEEFGESGRIDGRRFSPFLTSASTQLTLGEGSAFLRWLGLVRREESRSGARRDSTAAPLHAPGLGSFTGRNEAVGGGPWSLSLSYNLSRSRPPAADSLRSRFDRGNQVVGGSLAFSPTRNWGVNWTTSYSLTDREFSQHALSLTRDLYRWRASFDFYRAPTGNTQFSFRVHLVDLPDLKFDYDERNLGVDRPARPTQQ